MSKKLLLQSILDKSIGSKFPYQLPTWFSKIIAQWAWCILFAVIIVQPGIGWGYWTEARASGDTLNFFFYLAFVITATEMLLQILALPDLRLLKKRGWNLLYYSALLNIAYGIDRIFSTEGSIGPLFGMVAISAIFFYLLLQVEPHFKK